MTEMAGHVACVAEKNNCKENFRQRSRTENANSNTCA